MFVLQLNPMRSNAENVVPVARAKTREELEAFIARERVEPYVTDGQWHKVFRAGGPLEWFNAPDTLGEAWIGVPAIVYVGVRQDWMDEAGERYDRMLASIPEVPA
jgi:hypothetical protein